MLVVALLLYMNVAFSGESVQKATKPIPPVENKSLAKELADHNADVLQALQQPGFCEGRLLKGQIEVYRILWTRAFDPPLFITIELREDGSVFSTLTEINSHPLEGNVSRRVSTWINVCESQGARHEEDPAEYCEDYVDALRAMADEGFWSVPQEVDPGIVLDGSDWVIEGRRGKTCRVISRWSPSPDSPVFRFVWFAIRATEKRLYFDEVY